MVKDMHMSLYGKLEGSIKRNRKTTVGRGFSAFYEDVLLEYLHSKWDYWASIKAFMALWDKGMVTPLTFT